MRTRLPLVLLLLLGTFAAHAQPDFPELTSRVVDRAEMLEAPAESRIARMLAAHEQATSEQVVVVTLPDLQGYEIAGYGYQLGRHWGIGQKGEDNGALLIVARDERKIRIEVGYGLEGRLTDAQSSVIIDQVITPAFREGDFARGITEGTAAIVQVLGGEPLAQPRTNGAGAGERGRGGLSSLFFLLFVVVMGLLGGGRRGGRGYGAALLGGALLGAGMGRGHSGGGFGGGGFGGGGGGFGGGGASGGW